MKRIFLLLSLVAILGLIAGCSSSTNPTPAPAEEQFGSYTATDEAPAFADPDLQAIVAEDNIYNDPAMLTPSADSLEALADKAVFCFRMVWGNLAADTNIIDKTDWSGKLTISRGAVFVTRLIAFEPGQDSLIISPSETPLPGSVEWASITSSGYDGLALRLVIPPSTTDEVVTVTYESGQLSTTFTMDQLNDLDTLITIGSGNAISFQSLRCDGAPRHGALAGVWGRDTTGLGIFYGTWISNNGVIIGTVMGEWGTDSTGQQYFVGKYINETGRFQGFVKGVWYMRGEGRMAAGHFAGLILDAAKEPIGVLKGRFKPGDTRKAGYFAGRWCIGGECFSLSEQD
ncbi:MAG: hypothetical protein PHR28_06880 [candidate division Zixibacteria bacterium]|nr:hypothetical protein [candidate division Zixibacteria bacterium]